MKNENPPAFPNIGNSSWSMPPTEGMTLRDYFAGQALAGRMAWNSMYANWDDAAADAYAMADAMLAARNNIDSLAAAGEGGAK